MIIINKMMYFKSFESDQDFSFGMKRKGMVPIIRELETFKVFSQYLGKKRRVSNVILWQSC